ncbi:unnamed protein product [Leptidea sinapis]|uniref:Uncharacterized protein n=1 Tax=Leptidea sinapis TaxID=189913 RepID=A0A5E4PYA7_9NEOP|nr:unnamed protein product [Leptidea sinapis]
MFACSDGAGACVPWEYYCDGHADCADASDELACRSSPRTTPRPRPRPHSSSNETERGGASVAGGPLCEEHEFQCANGECIRKCANAPPPAPRPAPAPADSCAWPALRCDNGTRCVPLLQLCDGVSDCADGADEADRCGQ